MINSFSIKLILTQPRQLAAHLMKQTKNLKIVMNSTYITVNSIHGIQLTTNGSTRQYPFIHTLTI